MWALHQPQPAVTLWPMLPDALHTARLVVRPVAADDAGAIFNAYARDPEVTRYLSWRTHIAIDDTQAHIARCMANSPDQARTYVLTDRDDGQVCGSFRLERPAPHRVESGYVLARPRWGQGLMTEVLTEAAAWVMRQPGVFRFGAGCDVENLASARVMEKSGLACEGVRRRWLVFPNLGPEPRDCFSYVLCR